VGGSLNVLKKRAGMNRVIEIVLIILGGINHAFTRFDESRKMHHGLKFIFTQGRLQFFDVRKITLYELNSLRNSFLVTGDKGIIHSDSVTGLE